MIDPADLVPRWHDYGMVARLCMNIVHEWLPGAVVGAFTVVNSVRVLAYIPQIVTVARDTNGASGISYLTWGLFLISHLTTIAYALVHLGDAIVALLFLGNALACLAIIAITMVKRKRHAAQLGVGVPSMCRQGCPSQPDEYRASPPAAQS